MWKRLPPIVRVVVASSTSSDRPPLAYPPPFVEEPPPFPLPLPKFVIGIEGSHALLLHCTFILWIVALQILIFFYSVVAKLPHLSSDEESLFATDKQRSGLSVQRRGWKDL